MRSGQAVQQSRSANVVADLARRHEQADRTPVRIGHGVKLDIHAAFRATDQLPKAPLLPQARSRAVRLEIGRVDHDRSPFSLGAGQALHHPHEDARLALPLPAVVQRHVWAIDRRRVPAAQAVALDEDDPGDHPRVAYSGS